MRNERGITLIALVVTIVVLLILAGVTITYTLSSNGIFANAKQAEYNTELGNIRDYAAMARLDVMTAYYAKGEELTADEISTTITRNFPGYESSAIVTTAATAPKGVLAGSFDVTLKSKNIPNDNTKVTVNFDTNGKPVLTPGK